MLQDISLFRYKLPLRNSLLMGGQFHKHREGLLLRLTDVDGFVGWGEIAPLWGFSRETIPETLLQLVHLRAKNNSNPPPLPLGTWYPSVKFGLDSAFSDLKAKKSGNPRYNPEHQTVTLNMLLVGSSENILRRAELATSLGYRAIKLKVGQQKPVEDALLVREVAAGVGNNCTIRLDANRAWSLKDALHFAEHLQGVRIEYIEEPLKSPRFLPDFALQTGLPVALDESLRDKAWERLQKKRFRPTALIYKPMLSAHPAKWYSDSGSPVVISSSFESGVGMQALIALATEVCTPNIPIGLDTYNWLQEDVLSPRLPMDAPEVELKAVFDPQYQVQMTKISRCD